MSPSDESQQLSIGQMAEKGGVSRRTVRYYVQRGLLAAPLGSGRGSHYTQEHLERLIQIRQYQESGLSLEEIEALAAGAPVNASKAVQPVQDWTPPPQRSLWTRIQLDDGLELHLQKPPERLDAQMMRELRRAVREILNRER